MSILEKTKEDLIKIINICNEKPMKIIEKNTKVKSELKLCIEKHDEIMKETQKLIIRYSKVIEDIADNFLEFEEYEKAKERIR